MFPVSASSILHVIFAPLTEMTIDCLTTCAESFWRSSKWSQIQGFGDEKPNNSVN
jgi:hypothetical protein